MRRAPARPARHPCVARAARPATAACPKGGSVQPRSWAAAPPRSRTTPGRRRSSSIPAPANAHQRQFCGGSLLTSRIVRHRRRTASRHRPGLLAARPPLPRSTTRAATARRSSIPMTSTSSSAAPRCRYGPGQPSPGISSRLRSNFDANYHGDGVPRSTSPTWCSPRPPCRRRSRSRAHDEGALWDPGSPARSAAGGAPANPGGHHVDTLRAATVDVIPDSTCSPASTAPTSTRRRCSARATRRRSGHLLGGQRRPAQAPLGGGGYRLVGITGWGDGCAQARLPRRLHPRRRHRPWLADRSRTSRASTRPTACPRERSSAVGQSPHQPVAAGQGDQPVHRSASASTTGRSAGAA